MVTKDELLDELLKGYEKPEDLLGENGIFQELKKALVEKALGAELTHHLGYEKGKKPEAKSGNTRNGHGKKRVKSSGGEIELSVPRDRDGSFEPQLIKKGQRHFDGFDDKIISLYARGMTVREIQSHLKELYAVQVSPDLISRVTDAVMEEVREWQNRPLDALYPLVIFDALRVKIRDEGTVKNKAVYLALGMNLDGIKQVLGLWIEQTEGAKFWLRVTTNAIESLNRSLRKAVKTRGHFPNDQAATKLLYLAIKNLAEKWKRPPKDWTAAMNQFAILFDERIRAVQN
jgi:putative transposase